MMVSQFILPSGQLNPWGMRGVGEGTPPTVLMLHMPYENLFFMMLLRVVREKLNNFS